MVVHTGGLFGPQPLNLFPYLCFGSFGYTDMPTCRLRLFGGLSDKVKIG